MKGSLGAGEYPLLSPNQSLSNYEMCDYPRVKFRDGLQTEVEVPYDVNLINSNVANLNGRFYWVTAFRQKTAESDQYILTLDYMGPTSEYRTGDSIKGVWHRTPNRECDYLSEKLTNSPDYILEQTEIDALNIGSNDYYDRYQVYWMQVSGFDTNRNLRIIGFFVAYSEDENALSDRRIPIRIADASVQNFRMYWFPSYGDIMNNMTRITGLLADNVIDCSISKRCPFPFGWGTVGTGFENSPRIKDRTGTMIIPDDTDYLIDSGQYAGVYVIMDGSMTHEWIDNEATMRIGPGTSFYRRQCCHAQIRDWNGNAIMELPPSRGNSEITIRTHCDVAGVFTTLIHEGVHITIPEGKLPYVSNSWESYRAYQLQGDRQAMENAIRFAQYNKETSDMSGIANATINAVSTGAMTGAIAGNVAGAAVGVVSGIAGVGVNLWENNRAHELSVMQAEADFALSKKRAANAPQSGYNTAYGMIYCNLNERYPLSLTIVGPDSSVLEAGYINDWTDTYGYPAEGVLDIDAVVGYYQGKLLDRYGGMYADRTNETFIRGFRFVDP